MCVFSLLGNFECGNPEKLKSKCIPVMEAQEYIAVSRLQCASVPGRSWCFCVDLSSPACFFPFLFCVSLPFFKKKNFLTQLSVRLP